MFCSGFILSVPDSLHSGSLLSPHGFARLDFMLFPYGVSCVDSFLSALDFLHLEFFLSLRSSVRLGSVLLLYGIA